MGSPGGDLDESHLVSFPAHNTQHLRPLNMLISCAHSLSASLPPLQRVAAQRWLTCAASSCSTLAVDGSQNTTRLPTSAGAHVDVDVDVDVGVGSASDDEKIRNGHTCTPCAPTSFRFPARCFPELFVTLSSRGGCPEDLAVNHKQCSRTGDSLRGTAIMSGFSIVRYGNEKTRTLSAIASLSASCSGECASRTNVNVLRLFSPTGKAMLVALAKIVR